MHRAAILFAFGLVLAQPAAAETAPPIIAQASKSAVRPYSMERAESWTLRSKTGRVFEISVSRPSVPAPATGYPVIYVLDPSTAFGTLAETVRNQELFFGPAVVVGIGYQSEAEVENRSLDLTTPVAKSTLPAFFAKDPSPNGGADAFLAFIQDELKPEIERTISIDKSRQALFGHSFGGLFVLHTLFTHPEAFDTYVAGSPSIWWGRRDILKEVAAFEAAQAESNAKRRLLIAVGGLEAAPNPEDEPVAVKMGISSQELHDMLRDANMIDNAASLAARLSRLSEHGLEVAYAVFPGETHPTMVPTYLARGGRFTLQGWNKPAATPAP
jgi:predicted alpha/beta superfamily hydrolase